MVLLKEFENIKIKIGENSKENWEIIDNSTLNWYWFHLKSFPSCHVIVESEELSEKLVYFAAELCKKNTKYKNVPNLKINYCKIDNLIKSDKEGSVIFKSNRKLKFIKI